MSGPAPSLQYAWDGPGTNGAGQDGQALLWNQATGKFVMGAAGVSAHSGLTGLTSGDDHTQYLLVSGTRAMTGALLSVAGTYSAPGLAFSGEANTGFYKIATSTVRFTGSGTDSVQFASGGLDVVSGHLRGQGGYFDVTAGVGIIVAHGAAVVPWTVQGASAQTANLTNWKNSAGTVLTSVDAGGSIKAIGTAYNRKALYFGSTGGTSIGLYGTDSLMYVDAGGSTTAVFGWAALGYSQKLLSIAAGNVGLIIAGHASQTANLLEAQTSAAAVQFAIGAAGKILTNQAATNTNTPSGATAKAMPIYDAAGTLLGYMPVYASQW